MYGCSLPGQEEGGSGLEVEAADETAVGDFLFAPKDVKPWEFEAKDDVHGIGYSGMQEQSVLSTQQTSKALYGMSGQVCLAFSMAKGWRDGAFPLGRC